MQSRTFNTLTNLNISLAQHRAVFITLALAVVAILVFAAPEVSAGLASAPNSCPGC